MASTIAVSCPKCEKQIKAPAELAGKKIRCKECRHVFIVKAPPGAARAARPAKGAVPVAAAAEAEDDNPDPYQVRDHVSILPRCGYCAKELETEDQVICLNCGYNMRTRERVQPKKTYETTGGQKFAWLLPGILSALGFLTLIGIVVVFWLVFPQWEEDSKEWYGIFFGLWARIWGTVICGFLGFAAAKYAINRLIMDPTPPEVEKKK
jgi:DNA-directed RNA polymerase subunit RPC12/RpoP